MIKCIAAAILIICCVGCEVRINTKPSKNISKVITLYSGDKIVRSFKSEGHVYCAFESEKVSFTEAKTNKEIVLYGTIVVEDYNEAEEE